jgi:hypothetical protein
VLREVFDSAARFATTHQDLAAQLGAALTDDTPARRARGRRLAARHTWTTAAERHLAFYRSLLTDPAGRGQGLTGSLCTQPQREPGI